MHKDDLGIRDYYDEMCTRTFSEEGSYAATLGDWLELNTHGFDRAHDAGWKFKFSVADQDIHKACNIVTDVLLKSRTPQAAAFLKPEVLYGHKLGRSGKKIIVETMHTLAPAKYQELINRIEERFVMESIAPGAALKNERRVPNSPYTYYGYDRPAKGTYDHSEIDRNNYNPHAIPDPYKDFKVDKEFLNRRDRWEDSFLGQAPATQLPLAGSMTVDRYRKIVRELKAIGLKSEMVFSEKHDGPVLSLQGEDALRFRSLRAITNVLQSTWVRAIIGTGQVVCRTPIEGMHEDQAYKLYLDMQTIGLLPERAKSSTMGAVIRIPAQAMYAFQSLAEEFGYSGSIKSEANLKALEDEERKQNIHTPTPRPTLNPSS